MDTGGFFPMYTLPKVAKHEIPFMISQTQQNAQLKLSVELR